VTCCDLLGITQWEFKDERVLQGPRGISIDNDGNVYVVGYSTNNVVVISPDGQQKLNAIYVHLISSTTKQVKYINVHLVYRSINTLNTEMYTRCIKLILKCLMFII
jgi:DNA polymerase III psi subunit